MSRQFAFLLRHRWQSVATIGVALLLSWQLISPAAYGAQLGNRVLQISSSDKSAKTTYRLSFDLSTAGLLGSMRIQFCSNSPIFPDPCTAPSGFSVTGAALSDQSGQIGFSKSGSSTANAIVLTRPALPNTVGPVSYTFTNVTNPDVIGSYYVRAQTYASTDASGPASDYGGIGFAINNNLTISAEVPPYLIFCTGITIPTLNCNSATGDYINFGELSSARPSVGTSQILSSTNAKNGYNVTLTGTTLTSGNNAIDPIVTGDVSRPGTPQFGLNLRANASPSSGDEPNGPGSGTALIGYNTPNFFRFVPGDKIIASPKPDEMRRFTTSYLVNIPKTQSPGVYVSTVTYICLGNF
ncbi:MAG: hypothetical protein QFB87_01590 [Patescibacteria group bacterium]|nr:hypothetical protein [Patescibacteria group bacterium]